MIGGNGLSPKSSGKRKKNKEASPVSKKTARHAGQNKAVAKRAAIMRAEKATLVIMLLVLFLLLVIGPFYRGLFFPRELLIAQIAVFGLLIAWGCFRAVSKDGRLIETPLDACLLVLMLAYLVSFFVAVHKRDALEEVLKVASYLVIYLVTLDISRYWRFTFKKPVPDDQSMESENVIPPGLNLVLHMLLIVATVVTVASLGAAAGHWDFVGAYHDNRIASPMGYANTAAAYLMAAYLLNLGLAPLARKWQRAFYLAPASLMLITVVLTFSRGAWLLLPPLALLLILAAAPGNRMRSFLYILVTTTVAVPAAFIIDPIFRSGMPALAWVLIIPALILTIMLGLLVELYLSQKLRLHLILAGAGIALVIIGLFITIVIPLTGPLSLEQRARAPEQTQTFRQVIENVEPGETYQLTLQVNAEVDLNADFELPEYVWGIRVLGGLPGYSDEELLDYQGTATDGWQEKTFTFQTGEETTRFDIRLYNRYPGTSVTARSVILSSSDRDQELRFSLSRILPERFYNRIYSHSRDRNIDLRFGLYRDAVKIIRDYPLQGTGGGGWAAIYHGYQDQPFSSREIHNHFLQVWVEAGLFGFLAFAGIWISFTAAFIRNCLKERASPDRWQYWTVVFLPVAALGAHSVIDWNFSMAAVGFFLFALLGAGRSLDQVHWFARIGFLQDRPGRGLIIGIVAVMMGLTLMIYSIVLLNGLNATWHSQELMEQNNLKQAAAEMERAIRLDPFRAENYHNLGVLFEEQARRTQSQAQIEQTLHLAERAYELEPFDVRYVARYGDLLMNYVNIEEGLSYIDRAIALRPHAENSYIQPAWARLRLAEFFIENGNRSEAMRYLGEIPYFEQLMQERFGESTSLAYIMGRMNYLLGNRRDAELYYELVPEGDQFYEESRRRLAEM